MARQASITPIAEVRKFSTLMEELRQSREWLLKYQCTHVATESTGSYWRPNYDINIRNDAEVKRGFSTNVPP